MWLAPLFLVLRFLIGFAWAVSKPILGWLLIGLGLIGMPMPIVNGTIFLLLGLLLVGPRNPVVRWSRVRIKLLLRRWAALDTPIVGPIGRLANRSARQLSRGTRRLHWWWMERRGRRRLPAAPRRPAAGD